eukprot:scaffold268275_cov18-Tisochrysis_lutea.AAC.1
MCAQQPEHRGPTYNHARMTAWLGREPGCVLSTVLHYSVLPRLLTLGGGLLLSAGPSLGFLHP